MNSKLTWKRRTEMKEYKFLNYYGDTMLKDAEKDVNQMATEGWEVLQMSATPETEDNWGAIVFCMAREKRRTRASIPTCTHSGGEKEYK